MYYLNKDSITKRTLIVVLFIIILFATINKTFAVVGQTNEFYVNDYANLINSDVEKYIIQKNKDLYNLTGAQIVVVTVPNLGGNSIEEYSTNLFRKFGIGDKSKDNGVLLLLALEERQFRIEVGYGLEGVLNDGKTGRIQDEYIIPYLKQNDWNNGIKNGFDAVLQVITKNYNIQIVAEEPKQIKNGTAMLKNDNFVEIMLISMMISAFVGGILKIIYINGIMERKTIKLIIAVYTIALGIFYLLIFKLNTLNALIFKVTTVLINILILYMTYYFGNATNNDKDYWGSSGGSGFGSGGSFGGGGSSGGGGSTRGF